MSDPTTNAAPAPEAKKLSPDDPVDAETLAKFGQLQTARMQCAERLLDLEQEKVRTLRAAASIDAERQRIFESILTNRGLAPNFPVEIDAKTGKITPVRTDHPEMVAQAPENGAAPQPS